MQLYMNNFRGSSEALAATPEVARALAEAQPSPKGYCYVRVSIYDGRAETVFRKRPDGVWEHSTEYCDRCFGHIKQAYRPLRQKVAA